MTKQDLINIIIEEINKIDIDELRRVGGAKPTYDATETIGGLAVMALQIVLKHLGPDILAGTGAFRGDYRKTKQLVGKMKGADFVDGKFGPLTRSSLKLALKTPLPEGAGVELVWASNAGLKARRTGAPPAAAQDETAQAAQDPGGQATTTDS